MSLLDNHLTSNLPKGSKPKLSIQQIWSMSIGFLGIQCGFGLQNGNASGILQNFGAEVEHLSWFWLVAPLTGMIVQPIIGHYSDRTWNKLGRRKPFFLAGAILACFGLVFLPNSGGLATIIMPLILGAFMLILMDVSFNISMEPFRALIADNLSSEQRTLGFAVQTCLIGIGAVIGSWLPKFLIWNGVSGQAAPGHVPDNIIYSFYIGAFVFLAAILWTVIFAKEYSPEERIQLGIVESNEPQGNFFDIFKDFANMPAAMRQMGLVQFFSWFALFSMWVYTTSSIATHHLGLASTDNSSDQFHWAQTHTGFIFGIYNIVSAVAALSLPFIAKQFSRRHTHAFCLTMGGLGLISMFIIKDPNMLWISMVGVGIAWASILAMPYAILAGSIPAHKMGIYMGIFNFFITLPQIVSAIFLGPMVKYMFGSQAIYGLVMGGVFMLLGAVATMFVRDEA